MNQMNGSACKRMIHFNRIYVIDMLVIEKDAPNWKYFNAIKAIK